MVRMARGLLAAWHFLTVLRLPGAPATRLDDLRCALPFFPLVGVVLGGMLALLDAPLGLLFGRPLRDLIMLSLLVLMSGGLHLDGLVDTADGLFLDGSWEERLAAMHESRAGPRGAITALCLLLLGYSAIAALPDGSRLPGLVLAPTLGRWTVVVGYVVFPYARRGPGVSAALKAGAGPAALLTASMLAVAAGLLLCWPSGAVLLAGAGAFVFAAGHFASRRLGGMSGDVYGAVEQIVEVGVLAAVPLLSCERLTLG